MNCFVIFFACGRHARQGLLIVCLVSAVHLLPVCVSSAQASVALKSIALPNAIVRSVIVEKSQWQGIDVELERLYSSETLEATLEQLAMLMPELTPVWSEQGVAQAHWTSADASYAIFLWKTQTHATEGLLSGLVLSQTQNVKHNTIPVQYKAIDWLPKQAQQLFGLIDKSGIQPIEISGFTVLTTTSQLVSHLNAYGQRNGWVRLPDQLTFFRNKKRLSFQVMTYTGQNMVLVYETSRDGP